MGKIKKKFESGASTNYISRKQALRKLQLSLNDFRRLCILKGIHPHDPRHKKKVNKGSTEIRTWYYVKDIHFLAHEPIIQKFRDYRVFLRRLKKAKEKCETETVDRLYQNKPKYQLNHIVKERYPSIADAVRDLDDGLCLCFLFSRMPHSTVVFVSIKGIYYQADILGEKVTWIVPHERVQPPVTDVDFSIMATFLEFYIAMLGSVNCHLYNQLGLHYPPKLAPETSKRKDASGEYGESEAGVAEQERKYCLAQPLQRSVEADPNIDEEDTALDALTFQEENNESYERARREQERVKNVQKLFKGQYIFLNREVPRESLVFVIRSCGGDVSWDPSAYYGSTFDENNEKITYQIVDRPSVVKKSINRFYVQPQWVYDCVNAGKMLPADEYFIGCDLPPHLSPFVDEDSTDYIPPDRILQAGNDMNGLEEKAEEDDEKIDVVPKKKKRKTNAEQKEESGEMVVEQGKTYRVNKQKLLNEEGEHEKLREMMIAKKHKRVYHKIKRGMNRKAREVKKLQEKRKSIKKQNSET